MIQPLRGLERTVRTIMDTPSNPTPPRRSKTAGEDCPQVGDRVDTPDGPGVVERDDSDLGENYPYLVYLDEGGDSEFYSKDEVEILKRRSSKDSVITRQTLAVNTQGGTEKFLPGQVVEVLGRVGSSTKTWLVQLEGQSYVVPSQNLRTAGFGDTPAPNTNNAFTGPEEDSLDPDQAGADEARRLEEQSQAETEKDRAEDLQGKDDTSTTTGVPAEYISREGSLIFKISSEGKTIVSKASLREAMSSIQRLQRGEVESIQLFSSEGRCEVCGEPYQADSALSSLQVGEFWDPEKNDSILAHVECGLNRGLELA